jgi:hypothetical protein
LLSGFWRDDILAERLLRDLALNITNYTKFVLNIIAIVCIITVKLLWIRYVKLGNLFSNYAEPEQFRPGLQIVRKWEIYENCDYFNLYAYEKL